jgi:hypothetical protein
VASRPDILQKDLERARTLLLHLEAEYHALRKLRILSRDEVVALQEGPLREDLLTLAEGEEDRDDLEPPRNMLSAMEQRIEKALAEIPTDGLDEDDLKIRKVRLMCSLCASPAAEPSARLLYHSIWHWQPCAMLSIHATTAL